MACNAQTITINTDRPDQGDGTYTVPKNNFQLENGITIAKETVLNNFMLRYGLTSSTELRLVLDAGKEMRSNGLAPVTLSIKQRLVAQRKLVPAITLVGYLGFEQLASKDFRSKGVSSVFKLAFENDLSEKFSLGYNLGTTDQFNELDVTIGLSYAMADKVSTYLEYFAGYAGNGPAHNVDAGFLFLLQPRLQIDCAVGHSIFATESRFYTTVGISYLFNRPKAKK